MEEVLNPIISHLRGEEFMSKILNSIILSYLVLTGFVQGENLSTYPKYIKPPHILEKKESPTVILAGGCCTAWRDDFTALLKGKPWILLDPIGPEQERPYWENLSIGMADIYLMWIPEQGECRGSLVELGRFLEKKDKPLFIGVHPKSLLYPEVSMQIRHRPEVKLATSLEELAAQLCHYIHFIQID